jgi:hypothetical protein
VGLFRIVLCCFCRWSHGVPLTPVLEKALSNSYIYVAGKPDRVDGKAKSHHMSTCPADVDQWEVLPHPQLQQCMYLTYLQHSGLLTSSLCHDGNDDGNDDGMTLPSGSASMFSPCLCFLCIAETYMCTLEQVGLWQRSCLR